MTAAKFGPLNGFTDATPALDDIVPIYDTSAAGNRDTRLDYVLGLTGFEPGGRLCNATGDPYGSGETYGGTLYYAPAKHDRIVLYNGTANKCYTFTERSTAITGATSAGNVYDVFIYDASGTLTLILVAWTNTTTRATAVTFQNGFLCLSGTPTYRYLGTIYVTSLAGSQIVTDQGYGRHLHNYYNQVVKGVRSNIPTIPTWIYNSSTWRATNANTTAAEGRLSVVSGWVTNALTVRATATVINSSGTAAEIGIGVNSASANVANTNGRCGNNGINANATIVADLNYRPALGVSYVQQLEAVELGSATFGSDGANGRLSTGMTGTWSC